MKLAIIGASLGQLPLCLKAKEMGLETHCFAWPEGAICKDHVDYFYPISILEKDRIVEKCIELKVDGVVSNTSNITANVASYVSERIGTNGTPYSVLNRLQDKYYVRHLSETVEGLSKLSYYKYEGLDHKIYPCVVKPCCGSSKVGVYFAKDEQEFLEAISYAKESTAENIIVENFIDGKELSVESISFNGHHHVIQITDKDSFKAPHFVELGHHQPANIPATLKKKLSIVIPRLLDAIEYTNGPSHIEVKYNGDDIYLIEVNPRGGGDEISNKLVLMSSGIDYVRCIIEVALGIFRVPVMVSEPSFAGIYYLCKQTEEYLPFFEKAKSQEWYMEGEIFERELKESRSNYDRSGYVIYKSNKKITPYN